MNLFQLQNFILWWKDTDAYVIWYNVLNMYAYHTVLSRDIVMIQANRKTVFQLCLHT